MSPSRKISLVVRIPLAWLVMGVLGACSSASGESPAPDGGGVVTTDAASFDPSQDGGSVAVVPDAAVGDDAANTGSPETSSTGANADVDGQVTMVAADAGSSDAAAPIVVGDGETTRTILGAQGPNCVSCAVANGCLDPAQAGGACEDTPGAAPAACDAVFGMTSPVTETKVCLATLKMMFHSQCAADIMQLPCFCGLTDRAMCLDGTGAPTGPGVSLYNCDLGTTGIASLVNDFWDQTRGAGQANSIVDCLGTLGCDCFP